MGAVILSSVQLLSPQTIMAFFFSEGMVRGMSATDSGGKGNGRRIRIRNYGTAQKKDTAVKYVSLIVLVVQNASQVLIMRYVRTRPREMFLSTVAVFFAETVKLIACVVLIIILERSITKCLRLIHRDVIKQPVDTIKVCIPAVIYVIQNNLLYVAVSNLPAATYMVTYQLKILTAALFTVIILRRRLSLLQWLALVLLFGGIALVQLDEQKAKEAAKMINENVTSASDNSSGTTKEITVHKHITEQSPIKGFMAVLVACIMSGFAGIYFEKMLKGSDVSIWIRNVQLAVISLPFGLANVFIQDRRKVLEKGFMVGFDIVVWATIFLSSVGGITVAFVIKYADNILKAFATSIAIIVACIVSAVLFGFRPSLMFLGGTVLVLGAVFMYSLFPYQKKYQQAPTDLDSETQQKDATATV